MGVGPALSGVAALTVVGTLAFGQVTGPAGSAPLPNWSAGPSVAFSVPTANAVSGAWRVEIAVQIPAGADESAFPVIARWSANGDISAVRIFAGPSGSGGFGAIYTVAGTDTGMSSSVDIADGQWHHIRVDGLQPAGGEYALQVHLDGVSVMATGVFSGSAGQVTTGILNPSHSTIFTSIGQLAVYAPFTGSGDTYQAFLAYVGEEVTARITRLCTEEGVACTITCP